MRRKSQTKIFLNIKDNFFIKGFFKKAVLMTLSAALNTSASKQLLKKLIH